MISARALSPRVLPRWIGGLALTVAVAANSTRAQSDSNFGGNTPIFRPVPIFFPPNPPALGRLVSKLVPPTTPAGQRSAPAELASYITEPFYAPLSTLLVERRLSDKLRQRLEAYRSEREALVAELRAVHDRTRDDGAVARKTAFAALAQQQSTRLSALEVTAEQLRSDFVLGEYDWSAVREWRLGGRKARGDSPFELASVMRAYAYYQAGLAPVQRRMLREITVELMSGSEDGNATAAAQQFLFFSPEVARVKLPDAIPDAVAAQLARFETRKSALKKELFDAVVEQDGATFAFSRTGALKALAGRQAAEVSALEQLAEDIREGLASGRDLAPETLRSPLPPQLTQRTITAIEDRNALLRDSRSRIDTILARAPPDHPVSFPYSLDSDGIKVRPMSRRGRGGAGGPPTDPLSRQIMAELTAVGEDHKSRSETIGREIEALRADIGRQLGAKTTPLAIDQAVDGVVRHHASLENEAAYREYRAAVLDPGLSPAQRRLFFGGAIEKLELPLPRGDLQPTRRPSTW